MPLKIILLLLTEMVSLRGVNKVQATPTKEVFGTFSTSTPDISIGEYPLGGGGE